MPGCAFFTFVLVALLLSTCLVRAGSHVAGPIHLLLGVGWELGISGWSSVSNNTDNCLASALFLVEACRMSMRPLPTGPSVPAWMRPSPARKDPIVRATAARAAVTLAEVTREPFDDEVDSCLLSRQGRPWKRFWGDMWSARLDRESLHFLWRLTHRGLNIGASRLPAALHQGQPDALGACLCSAATCDGLGVNMMEDRYGLVGFLVGSGLTANAPLETHLHHFWECPTVKPAAIVWLWQLWQQIVGQARAATHITVRPRTLLSARLHITEHPHTLPSAHAYHQACTHITKCARISPSSHPFY